MSTQGSGSDRNVLLLMVGVVVIVLATNVISALVPGMDDALRGAPVLLVILVVGTLWIMYRALVRRR
ncbi:MAG: hypothetical protein ABIZ34_09835 [Candidatus Limnocylindrales bacterium]